MQTERSGSICEAPGEAVPAGQFAVALPGRRAAGPFQASRVYPSSLGGDYGERIGIWSSTLPLDWSDMDPDSENRDSENASKHIHRTFDSSLRGWPGLGLRETRRTPNEIGHSIGRSHHIPTIGKILELLHSKAPVRQMTIDQTARRRVSTSGR